MRWLPLFWNKKANTALGIVLLILAFAFGLCIGSIPRLFN